MKRENCKFKNTCNDNCNKCQSSKTNKTRNIIWTMFGIILMGFLVMATTTITENTITSENVTVENIIAGNLFYGSANGTFNETVGGRPLTSNAPRTITVDDSGGADYLTIQDAVNQVPFILRHRWVINVADGTYDEDVYVPPITVSGTGSSEGSVIFLKIKGESWDNTKVKSFQISGTTGALGTWINNFNIYGREPRSDENISISVYGSNSVLLTQLNFTSSGFANYAIMGYASNLAIHTIHFDNMNNGFLSKNTGTSYIGDWFSDAKITGTVSNRLIIVGKGNLVTFENNQVTGYDRVVDCNGGEAYEYDNSTDITQAYCGEFDKDLDLSNGLILYLAMNQGNESTSTVAYDSSNSGWDGTLTNSSGGTESVCSGEKCPTWINSRRFSGIEFDGKNDRIKLINSENYVGGLTTLTLSAWVKPTDTQVASAYIIRGALDNIGFSISTGSNSASFIVLEEDSDYVNTPGAKINPNEWNHLVGVYDAVNGFSRLYINGDLKTSSSDANDKIETTPQTLNIGWEGGAIDDRYFNGTIDEVMIWNKSLSESEVKALYNSKALPPGEGHLLIKDSNITIGDKITFAFGEFIDNLVDGWIRITGNLEVTENLVVLNNATINDTLTIGSGDRQYNITLTSPDGTEYTCGVANGGALTCT